MFAHSPDRIRRMIGWWTVITWSVYVASFPTSFVFITAVKIAWFILALAGFAGGIMALRKLPGWRPTLYATYALVLAWSLIYWFGIIDKILIHEETKTVSHALFRISRMVGMSFSAATRDGTMFGTLATFYREIVMPLLQVVAVMALLFWAATRGAVPPNPTVETDARKSRARGSL